MHTLLLLDGELVRILDGRAHLHVVIVDKLFGWARLEGADRHGHNGFHGVG